MSRHRGLQFYALCDHRDDDGRRCRAFILPPPEKDPSGPGAVIAGNLAVTRQAIRADWWTGDDADYCPEHWPPDDPREPVVAVQDVLVTEDLL